MVETLKAPDLKEQLADNVVDQKELKQLDDFITISEDEIKYWTVWLMHLLKLVCEPSCAISMAAAYKWLQKQKEPKTILVILSGGNVDPSVLSELLNSEYLLNKPNLR